MRRLVISAFLGTLALGAMAQTQPEQSIQIIGNPIQLPEHRYPMFAGDFDVYRGLYDLSNGQTMRLRVSGNHMFAEIGDGERKPLVAASRNTFVALDRSLKMTLDVSDYDNVTGEMLMVAPSQTAQNAGTVEPVRLMTSR